MDASSGHDIALRAKTSCHSDPGRRGGTGGGKASLHVRGLWTHDEGHVQVSEASVEMR